MESDLVPQRSSRGFLRRLLRRALPEPSPRTEAAVIAIASGKGGTGKSFLTTNLAIALHRRGLRVVVVDCDFGLANAHLLFGVNPRHSIQHLLDGRCGIAEVATSTSHGPDLVAGGSGLASLAELGARHMQMLARAFGELARSYDVLLIDCAAGLSPQAMLTVLAAQEVILVTNPEIAALTDAYAVIKCLSRQVERPEVRLVVNRVSGAQLARVTFDRLADVSRRFAGVPIHYLGAVGEDPSVIHRRLGQAPILLGAPECETSKELQQLASGVEARVRELGAAVPTRGVELRMITQIRRW